MKIGLRTLGRIMSAVIPVFTLMTSIIYVGSPSADEKKIYSIAEARALAKQTYDMMIQAEKILYLAILHRDIDAYYSHVLQPVNEIGKLNLRFDLTEEYRAVMLYQACFMAPNDLKNYGDVMMKPSTADRVRAAERYQKLYHEDKVECERLLHQSEKASKRELNQMLKDFDVE